MTYDVRAYPGFSAGRGMVGQVSTRSPFAFSSRAGLHNITPPLRGAEKYLPREIFGSTNYPDGRKRHFQGVLDDMYPASLEVGI